MKYLKKQEMKQYRYWLYNSDNSIHSRLRSRRHGHLITSLIPFFFFWKYSLFSTIKSYQIKLKQ